MATPPHTRSFQTEIDRAQEMATPENGDGMRAGASHHLAEEAGNDGAQQRQQGDGQQQIRIHLKLTL